MLNLLKCHFAYLLNLLTIVFLIVINIVIMIFCISVLSSLNIHSTLNEQKEIYLMTVIETIKLLDLFLVVFVGGFSFLNVNDQYRALVISYKITRLKYFVSKLLMLIIVIMFMIICQFLIFNILGFTKNIVIPIKSLNVFVDLTLFCLYFLFVSIFFSLLTDNYFSSIIVLLLYFLSQIEELNSVKYFVCGVGNNLEKYYFLLVLIIAIADCYYYQIKDLQN